MLKWFGKTHQISWNSHTNWNLISVLLQTQEMFEKGEIFLKTSQNLQLREIGTSSTHPQSTHDMFLIPNQNIPKCWFVSWWLLPFCSMKIIQMTTTKINLNPMASFSGPTHPCYTGALTPPSGLKKKHKHQIHSGAFTSIAILGVHLWGG